MLKAHRAGLLRHVPDDARVLDVGGWAAPLARADWVLDIAPYETRGWYGDDPDPERFTADTWVQRDICAREPWPFADNEFDFAVCSHTLEDIRDPIWVCEELSRVARAGYVEVPSRVHEQTWGFEGAWSGYSHHRWLCEADRERSEMRFTFKYHLVHDETWRLPPRFAGLSPEQRVDWLWWEGSFTAREIVHLEPEVLFAELSDFRARHIDLVPEPPRPPLLRRLARRVRRPLRRLANRVRRIH